MTVLLTVLWCVLGAEVPLEGRDPEAVEVFSCQFDRRSDRDFDEWPDGWTRQRGPGFPHYVGVKISGERPPSPGRCLRMELDGGGAAAYSPPIPISPSFSYVLEVYLKTEGLQYDRAYVSITWLDGDRRCPERLTSEKIAATDGWRKLRLGPCWPGSEQARYALIGLHVEPQSRQDLRGAACFADVWLGRLPRVRLGSSDPQGLFTAAKAVEVTCTVSGFVESRPVVRLQLEDAFAAQLARVEQPLEITLEAEGHQRGQNEAAGTAEAPVGTVRWRPPLAGPGFYRVRAALQGHERPVDGAELTLAVIEPSDAAGGGPFGWSLPRGAKPLPLPALYRLIVHAGVGRVKYPLWFDQRTSDAEVEELLSFTERLTAQGIEVVGLLSAPPPTLQQDFGPAPPIAEVFAAEAKVWYPSLETVMSRLATRVRCWQLGEDKDDSFAGYADPAVKVTQVKQALDRIGQDVNVGMGWSWSEPFPAAAGKTAPWRFLALSSRTPLSPQELGARLDASRDAKVQRWVVLEPLPRNGHSPQQRITDLVQQMIAAKIHGAEAAFCPDPFRSDRGLMNDDGTPGELFLPWRTTASVLGAGQYLGSFELPGGSQNHVFSRSGEAVMVVWNDRPGEEELFLGAKARQTDLWGRRTIPAARQSQQVIAVGPLPTFVTGLDEPIARWSVDLKLDHRQLPAILGRPHENTLRLKNPFPQAIAGQAALVVPEGWKAQPRQFRFHLAAGEQLQQRFVLTLPQNAIAGRQPVRFDFEVQGQETCRFSVYRPLEVGDRQLRFELATRLGPQGDLEVSQRLINDSDRRASFRCQLYAPERQRQQALVRSLPQTSDARLYRLPAGQELLGKTLWLRAEEIDGPRTLNYRLVGEK